MTYALDYVPTKKQAMFHSSKADEVLYGGAAGGGKSRAIVMEAVIDALEHDGIDSYLFRRSYPELEATLLAEALRCVPRDLYTYSKTSHDMRLKNGSTLHFRFCRNTSDPSYGKQYFQLHFIPRLLRGHNDSHLQSFRKAFLALDVFEKFFKPATRSPQISLPPQSAE